MNAVDRNGLTPLHWASWYGHVDIVMRLLKKGAYVNAANGNGWTPLHQASQHGHIEVAKLLAACSRRA